jgi:hypothetical protein
MDELLRVTCASVTSAAIPAFGALASPGPGDPTLLSGQVHALAQEYSDGSLFSGSNLLAIAQGIVDVLYGREPPVPSPKQNAQG